MKIFDLLRLIDPDRRNQLSEAQMEIAGTTVWENPSLDALRGLSRHGDLRGLADQNDYYVYSAGDAYHEQIRRQLGLPESTASFVVTSGGPVENTYWDDAPYVVGRGIRIYWSDEYHHAEYDLPVGLRTLLKRLRGR